MTSGGRSNKEKNVGTQQGCQIFPGTSYQNGEKIPNYQKYTKRYILDGHQIYNIFNFMALQNAPKMLVFLNENVPPGNPGTLGKQQYKNLNASSQRN
jgi:hypothetical protein